MVQLNRGPCAYVENPFCRAGSKALQTSGINDKLYDNFDERMYLRDEGIRVNFTGQGCRKLDKWQLAENR